MRVVQHPEGGFGLVVDLSRKLVSSVPLPLSPMREKINGLKGRSCVYKMGNRWFEISIDGLADLKVNDPCIPLGEKVVSLIQYLNTTSSQPVPSSIANLSPEGAAIWFRTNGVNQKLAPTSLCYPVQDTHTQNGAGYHHETIIEPDYRHRQIRRLVKMFLEKLSVGDTTLTVSHQLGKTRTKPFLPPELRFGNDETLSLGTNKSNLCEALKDYGRKRLTLLKDEKAGFFEQSPLDRQYVVLPKSVEDTFGSQFLKDLKTQVDDFYPQGGGYNPEIIAYDDLNGPQSFAEQSRAIKNAVEVAGVSPGFALVVAHRYARRPRSADQLAAWTVKEFPRLFGLNAAVIHTDMPRRAYISKISDDRLHYKVKHSEYGRFSGYLRNVTLNKILLTNGKWPFILDSPLYADVVIGIDVKTNTAAFTLIANSGKIIRLSMSSSKQKERLLKNQVKKCVIEMIETECAYFNQAPKQIVIHRDGRAWPPEINGLKEACEQLAKEGHLNQNWQLTVIEILKSSPAPLRLFDVKSPKSLHEFHVENPIVGNWTLTSPHEGYICTTGQPFPIPGTSKPLHIRRSLGDMSIEYCLSDIFSLSCLTWTRPEGVTRLPISIKLCDRSLFDEAAEYDSDAIDFEIDNNL